MMNRIDKVEGNSLASLTIEKEQIGGGMLFGEKTNGVPGFVSDATTRYDENGNYVSGIKGSYVETISNVSNSLINSLTKDKLIERTPGYVELLNKIMINLGLGHSMNEDKIKRISSMLYPYVLSTSGNDLYNFIQDKKAGINDIEDMLDTLPKDVLKLKANEKYSDNPFLKEIYVDEAKGFISFNNVSNYTPAAKITIKDGANSLYSNKETRAIMERMVKYSFFTTGFRPSSYSFANYTPKRFFVDSLHNESIKDLLIKLNNKDAYVENHLENAMMFLASNRPEDDTINKVLKGKTISIPSGVPVKNESLVKKLMYIDPDTKQSHFYPFVSVSKPKSISNYALVKVDKAKKEGEPDQPTYESINVMQYQAKDDFGKETEEDKEAQEEWELENDDSESEAEEDESGPKDFSLDERRSVDKKKRASRLLLFDPNLATPEFLFKNNKNARLELRRTDNNLYSYNNQVLFQLNKSEEAIAGEKERAAYLDGLRKGYYSEKEDIENMKSNNDVYDSLLKTVSLDENEISEYQKIIDHFYTQDKDAFAKQKATNELDRLKGCN
jgi:hypothetical protein